VLREGLEVLRDGLQLRPGQLGQGADVLGRRVCVCAEGLVVYDLADGVPQGGFEAFTFFDLFRRWKGTAERKMTARDAPTPVRADPEKYAYLLPGGCERELKPHDGEETSVAVDFELDKDGF